MGQEAGKKWTAAAALQPALPKSDRLLGCLDSVERWKEIRELRNAVNHEYEDDPKVLHEFFEAMLASAPELLRWHDQLLAFCRKTYPR